MKFNIEDPGAYEKDLLTIYDDAQKTNKNAINNYNIISDEEAAEDKKMDYEQCYPWKGRKNNRVIPHYYGKHQNLTNNNFDVNEVNENNGLEKDKSESQVKDIELTRAKRIIGKFRKKFKDAMQKVEGLAGNYKTYSLNSERISEETELEKRRDDLWKENGSSVRIIASYIFFLDQLKTGIENARKIMKITFTEDTCLKINKIIDSAEGDIGEIREKIVLEQKEEADPKYITFDIETNLINKEIKEIHEILSPFNRKFSNECYNVVSEINGLIDLTLKNPSLVTTVEDKYSILSKTDFFKEDLIEIFKNYKSDIITGSGEGKNGDV